MMNYNDIATDSFRLFIYIVKKFENNLHTFLMISKLLEALLKKYIKQMI